MGASGALLPGITYSVYCATMHGALSGETSVTLTGFVNKPRLIPGSMTNSGFSVLAKINKDRGMVCTTQSPLDTRSLPHCIQVLSTAATNKKRVSNVVGLCSVPDNRYSSMERCVRWPISGSASVARKCYRQPRCAVHLLQPHLRQHLHGVVCYCRRCSESRTLGVDCRIRYPTSRDSTHQFIWI